MMRKTSLLFTLLAHLILFPNNILANNLTGSLCINEIMQSYIDGYFDQLNDIPDSWVEIYNPNNHSVQLKGYRIGKTNSFIRSFILPAISIPAKGHYLVFCDKSDIIINGEAHSDFRLNSDKEGDIYLFQPDGKLADHLSFPAMPAPHVAYGRLTDGSDILGYELNPTPGTSNCGGHAKAILPNPSFNTSSSIVSYAEDEDVIRFTVFIPNHAPEGTVARYTTDGSEPTIESPILSKATYFSKNTIVKTALFADSCITPPSVSRIFIFHGRNITLPVVSINTQDSYLNDADIGILANNHADSRVNWRRPAIFDYFPKSSSRATISQRCEIRVGGAYTRQWPLKSLVVYASKRFGTNNYFTAQFWPDRPYTYYSKSIMLRNSGNDFLYSNFRDGAIQRTVGPNCDLDWQGFQPAIFYINGKYKGIINIRERANEDNVWAHYNRLKDIDLLELNAGTGQFEVKEGSYDNYNNFYNFYSKGSPSYEEFDSIMDVVQYTNHIITNTFFGNEDYPGNNCVLWRPQTEGGRWRWIMKDTDFGMNLYGFHPHNENYLNWILREEPYVNAGGSGNTESATLLIRQLMKNNEYKEMFIDRFTVYMGDFLNSDHINPIINSIKKEIEYEYPYHQKSYPDWNSWLNWNNHIEEMQSWCKNRTTYMWTHLKNFFSLGALVPCTVNTNIDYPEDFDVIINNIPLTQGVFKGNFFSNRNYTIEANYYDDQYAVIGWEISSVINGRTLNTTTTGSVLSYIPISGTTQLSINAIKGTNGIEDISSGRKEVVKIIYINSSGQQSETPFNGLNIIKRIYKDGTSSNSKEYLD